MGVTVPEEEAAWIRREVIAMVRAIRQAHGREGVSVQRVVDSVYRHARGELTLEDLVVFCGTALHVMATMEGALDNL